GQGTVIASILLSKALFQAGYKVQSFPVFGVERRGAPVEAYVRLDKENIRVRTNVYNPDHVIVQDHTLLQSIDVTRGMKPEGWILVNSPGTPADLDRFAGFRLAIVDANRIALRNKLGTRTHPIVNTPMIGAFARVFEMPSMDAIVIAIGEEISIHTERNIQAAREAYDEVQLVGLIMKSGVAEA
ncbi:MAG: 2-oxoacid:acceptor oxidoreductase family protein, partial [Deltaproteobacteria bacterium]|nr:2-oxoacid:acceptor oxidoreductase family protein [Deltaproteobacteria bacterium]